APPDARLRETFFLANRAARRRRSGPLRRREARAPPRDGGPLRVLPGRAVFPGSRAASRLGIRRLRAARRGLCEARAPARGLASQRSLADPPRLPDDRGPREREALREERGAVAAPVHPGADRLSPSSAPAGLARRPRLAPLRTPLARAPARPHVPRAPRADGR